jgi:hypothetical protein
MSYAKLPLWTKVEKRLANQLAFGKASYQRQKYCALRLVLLKAVTSEKHKPKLIFEILTVC